MFEPVIKWMKLRLSLYISEFSSTVETLFAGLITLPSGYVLRMLFLSLSLSAGRDEAIKIGTTIKRSLVASKFLG